jgi:hypothetical protein
VGKKATAFSGGLELTFPSRPGWLRLAWVPRETDSSGPKSA